MEIFGTVLDVRSLFGQERRELLQLLDSLSAAEWSAPTVCPGWTVHDLAGHILSDYMRRLSRAGTAWPGRSSPRRDPARLPGPGQRRVRPRDAAGQPRADRPVAHRPRSRARPRPADFWRLATRGISVDEARRRADLHGDRELAEAVTTLLAVVA